MLGRRHHGLAGRTLRVWGPKARLTGYFDRSRKICTAYCPSLFEGIRPAWKAAAGGTHLLRTSALTREARHGRLVPTSAPAKEMKQRGIGSGDIDPRTRNRPRSGTHTPRKRAKEPYIRPRGTHRRTLACGLHVLLTSHFNLGGRAAVPLP